MPAGFFRRFGAMLYDTLLVVAVWMFTLFPLVALSNDYVFGAAVQSLLFLELFLFFVWSWVYRGQTLGMMAWRLRVEAEDGGPLRLLQATARFFAALLAFLPLGLGQLWIFVHPDRKSWSDLMSSSRIVVVPRKGR